jgi:hypothetical protein
MNIKTDEQIEYEKKRRLSIIKCLIKQIEYDVDIENCNGSERSMKDEEGNSYTLIFKEKVKK